MFDRPFGDRLSGGQTSGISGDRPSWGQTSWQTWGTDLLGKEGVGDLLQSVATYE
ncbi:MAG: hypothetical protein LBQ77_03220 [Treponema sp.]|nr:hypothetical protein [Treponema sp.]